MISLNLKKLATSTKDFVYTHRVLLLSGLGVTVLLVAPQGVFASYGTENNTPLPVIEENQPSIVASSRNPKRLWSLTAATSLYIGENMAPSYMKPAFRLARTISLAYIPISCLPPLKK